jgi:hypothetical protein
VTKDFMNFAQTQVIVCGGSWQNLQIADCWVFLIVMWENALFCVPVNVVNFRNLPPSPNIHLDLP